ncbi:MAG TPA: DUF885 domain-containing protein [Acidimicrobiia bacterium]|nr:DUF885 domain-containing protein [Acidimicrobiia bacterium]
MSEIERLSERFWDLSLEASPSMATLLGDRRFDHQLEDLSPEFLDKSLTQLREVTSQAAALDSSAFDRQQRLTQAMLLSEASDALTMIETRVMVASPDPLTGPASGILMYAGQTAAQDAIQAGALFERYRLVPRLLAQALDLHKAEVAAGRTPIAANVQRVMSQVDDYLASPLETDPFANLAGPEGWNGLDKWREDMASLANDAIRPAFSTYREGVEALLTSARNEDHSGLCHIAGGDEIYARMIEIFTTLPYSAQELHDIGQSQAKGIHADEFRETGQRALGTSDLAVILDKLRNDPSLRYSTSEQIVAHAEEIVARSWEASADWFNLRPVGSCAVQQVPEFMAKNAPPAYYFPPASDGLRPGTYFINTYDPGQRVRYAAEAVAFHEANPGHHFQLTLAAELTNIPEFRKRATSTAYVEGWGLYAERLADEMHLYSSDTDRLGMVSADAWRAGRLVVDTGVHALGWNRRQAVEYLEQWTAIDPQSIETEVDRYIGVPGQALAYKAGQIEILRLREEARADLGDRFDIKGFHDTVLGSGPMTLPMLGGLVADWVKTVA